MSVPQGHQMIYHGMRGRRFIEFCSVSFATIGLIGCDRPIVLKADDFVSPDSHWTATLERVDNGLGFGQGALYYEVHLSKTGSWRYFWRHGDPEKSVIFYAPVGYPESKEPEIKWTDSQHLLILCRDLNNAGRKVLRFHDVDIRYALPES